MCEQKCEHILLTREMESEIESIQRKALAACYIFPEFKYERCNNTILIPISIRRIDSQQFYYIAGSKVYNASIS